MTREQIRCTICIQSGNIMMKRIIVFICLSAVVLSCLCGCGTSGREYKDDIEYNLTENDGALIIKEWTFLQGSGAEIYYKIGDTMTLLGNTTGADNGFCPFAEGSYEIKEYGDSVCVSWCFRASDNDRSHWKSKTFEFPV